MTDFAEDLRSAVGFDRAAAFRAAGRHSSRVRLLRRAMVGLSTVLVLAVAIIVVFDPFRSVPAGVSIGPIGLDGTRVSMDKPKLSGFRKDGRPYQITAASAVQDVRKPNILELHTLDAHFTMGDQSVAHVVSKIGIYDSSLETMRLVDDVRITGASGYDITMQGAMVDFKSGGVVSDQPVTVTASSGTVTSDRMSLVDNGRQITFEGHVHSLLLPGGVDTATAREMKGTTP